MFWADQLLENIDSPQIINDAWTPSGIVHMGGIKGPVLHDVLFKILKDKGCSVKYTFGFDDFDPIDGLPKDLLDTHKKYMGIPVCYAPSPDGKGSFAQYYSNMMRDIFEKLDIKAEIYLASDYYKKGIYNDAIRFVLDNADKVRKVYSETYGKEIDSNWFPLQVVCPDCKKLGTTKVVGWDGKEVEYECAQNLVDWAEGCGKKGKISPFDGNAKMPFKVEWAAKWWTFGVTIEGAGKDHASAGGTYDVARKICKDVFGKEPPLALPYEFFLYDGKKMSSSKGLGLTGQELLRVLPPQLVRFLMIKTPPNKTVEFNPNGTLIIPKLYDEYQTAAKSDEDYLKRAYEFSKINGEDSFAKVRFLTLAQWVQMPNMEDQIKDEGAGDWTGYAKLWVEKYAPENERFLVSKNLPKETEGLTQEQKDYLCDIAKITGGGISAEELQAKIYELSKRDELTSKDAFKAIYISLLGKDHGPKAAWLIASLDQEFVKRRFTEIK